MLKATGSVNFGPGSRVVIEPNGLLEIGTGFNLTACSTITCWNSIKIGCNCLMSWGCHVSDTDYHYTINPDSRECFSPFGSIEIGNGVWLCMHTVILKNTFIPDGSIVAAGSLVNKKFDIDNSLIAGNPAVVKKHNIRLAQKGECPEIWPMRKRQQ